MTGFNTFDKHIYLNWSNGRMEKHCRQISLTQLRHVRCFETLNCLFRSWKKIRNDDGDFIVFLSHCLFASAIVLEITSYVFHTKLNFIPWLFHRKNLCHDWNMQTNSKNKSIIPHHSNLFKHNLNLLTFD